MNILKLITLVAVSVTLSATVSSAQEKAPMVSAYLIKANAQYQRVLILGAKQSGKIFYKEKANAVETLTAPMTRFSGIWLFEPKDFTAAKNLFESRKYQEAKDAFIALQKRYKNFKYLDDSYFEQSQFYEMECYRKLKEYQTLTSKLELYKPERLTRPGQIAQTELYRLYDAVDKKDWSRLNTMCEDYAKKTGLTLSQRAQVSFCQGLAYEGLKNNNNALNAYATAMTADFTRSETIVRESMLNSLRILEADKEIEIAIGLWETPEERPSSSGYKKLMEANALARIYVKAGIGRGVSLPAKYKKFLKFTSKAMQDKLAEREGEFATARAEIELKEKAPKAKVSKEKKSK